MVAAAEPIMFHGQPVREFDRSMPEVDAIAYEVAIDLDDTTVGAETYRATATDSFFVTAAAGLDHLNLDLRLPHGPGDRRGNVVDTVEVGGADGRFQPATFELDPAKDRLRVALGRTIPTGRKLVVRIGYHGAVLQADGLDPNDFRNFGGLFVRQSNKVGKRIFSSMNWPAKAHWWLPLRDHPRDGVLTSMDLSLSDKYTVLANGAKASDTASEGRRTVRFVNRAPLPTYDIHVAAYDGWATSEIPSDLTSIRSYAYTEHANAAAPIVADVGKALRHYVDTFGEFRWDHADYIEEPIFGGGMENATAITLDEGLYDLTKLKRSRNTAIHELGHHWSGNASRIRSWSDLWLSEGFTEYLTTTFYVDNEPAESAAWALRYRITRGLTAERVAALQGKPSHPLRPAGEDTDPLAIFDGISYGKGAYVLRMLEQRLGATFRPFLKTWFATHAFRPVTTAQLESELRDAFPEREEEIARFFAQWVYGSYHPEVDVKIVENPSGGSSLSVAQLQRFGPEAGFDFPLEIDVFDSSGAVSERVSVEVHERETVVSLRPGSAPAKWIVDPDQWNYLTVVCDATTPCREAYICRYDWASWSVPNAPDGGAPDGGGSDAGAPPARGVCVPSTN
jgi:aminopeptidase N